MCVALVQLAGDEGLGDGSASVGGEPFEDFLEHLEGVEASGHGWLSITIPRSFAWVARRSVCPSSAGHHVES